jgi:hypothetical protein
MSLLRSFPVTDAVEGSVEVRMELARALDTYGGRVRAGIAVMILAIVLAMLSVLPSAYSVGHDIVRILYGEAAFTLAWAVVSAAQLLLGVLVWAVGITIMLFLLQSRRFLAFTRARYDAFERMGSAAPPPEGSAPRRPADARAEMPKDPARALISLVHEVEQQVPQVDRMHKYTAAFTVMLLLFLGVEVALDLAGPSKLAGSWFVATVAIQVSAAALLVVSLGLMLEIGRYLRYVNGRHRALEAFEAEPPCPVPPGRDAVERFMRCLAVRGEAGAWGDGSAPGPGEAEGTGGRRHRFDAVAGGPGERVLVRAYPGTPTLEEVRALRDDAEDVARRDGRLPRRVVALVAEGEADVPDEVYSFLLERPVMDVRGERSRTVQVVSECEGFYCPVPFVAPDS